MFSEKVLIFDGGIGTELYERGYYINRPFEELNLSAPHEVRAMHKSYAQAGADVLTTNTYAISRSQLARFGISEQQKELLLAGINLAYESKTSASQKIALSLGPLGIQSESFDCANEQVVKHVQDAKIACAQDEFRRIAKDEFTRIAEIAFEANRIEKKIDLYALETFTNLEELHCAIQSIRQIDQHTPLLASISLTPSEHITLKQLIEQVACMDKVSAIGINCSDNPDILIDALKIIVPQSKKPIVVRPNAGLPRQIQGRYFYLSSPDYLAKMAKRFVQIGARGVGGCCGTGPAHIKAICRALRMVQPKHSIILKESLNKAQILQLQPQTQPHSQTHPQSHPIQSNPNSPAPKNRSKILETISQGKKVISVELMPPKGVDMNATLKQIENLAKSGVSYVNIPDGARASARISSLHLAGYINRLDCGIKVMPHFTTRDRNLIGLQADLLGAHLNDVYDILVVTGDPPKSGGDNPATGVYDLDSLGLVHLIHSLNNGRAPNGELLNSATGFGIGVAANPTAMNLDLELKRWKHKVNMGADFAVTQPVFDAQSYLKWRDKIKKHDLPHLVGIWPFVSFRNAEFLANEVPGILVPKNIMDIMHTCKTDSSEAQKRGVEIARDIMDSLKDYCDGFCISAPLGKVSVVMDLLQ